MQTSDPDTRLMLAFRDGDTAALSELYRHWAGPLLRCLERMVREKSIAEELMQETFIRVHGARDRYVPEARFSTWLFRIGRNLALNELERVRSRAPHLTTDESPREPGATRRAPLVLVATQSAVDELVAAAALAIYLGISVSGPATREGGPPLDPGNSVAVINAAPTAPGTRDIGIEDEMVWALGYVEDAGDLEVLSGSLFEDLEIIEQLELLDYLSAREAAFGSREERG